MPHILSNRYAYQNANYEEVFERAQKGELEYVAIGANINFQGFGKTQVNTLLAREWLEIGAAHEAETKSADKLCTVMLALMQYTNTGVIDQKQKDAGRKTLLSNKQWIIDEANAGNTQCERILGALHGHGIGFGQNLKEAVKWWQKAADKGDPFALHTLGLAYSGQLETPANDRAERLRAIPVDLLKAAENFDRAAQMGHSDAQNELGLLISTNFRTNTGFSALIVDRVVSTGEDEASFNHLQSAEYGFNLIKEAAEQGRVTAMHYMGRIYLGVPAFAGLIPEQEVSKETAASWFKAAMDKGLPASALEYAKICETYAAEHGETHEELNLATAYCIYDDLLGRNRKLQGATLETQPLTIAEKAAAERARKELEEKCTKWERHPNGDRTIWFADKTKLHSTPHMYTDQPERDVPAEIARASDFVHGKGHMKSAIEAFAIYDDLLNRATRNPSLTKLTDKQIAEVKAQIAALQDAADTTEVDPETGKRTLHYKREGRSGEVVYAEATPKFAEQKARKEKQAAERAKRDAEKAARLAARGQATTDGTAQRPADNSQTGKQAKKGADKKPGT